MDKKTPKDIKNEMNRPSVSFYKDVWCERTTI